jgi:hypothetical protein
MKLTFVLLGMLVVLLLAIDSVGEFCFDVGLRFLQIFVLLIPITPRFYFHRNEKRQKFERKEALE